MIYPMSGSLMASWVLLGLVGLSAGEQRPAFSADLVTTTRVGNKATARLGRVYVSNGKVRIEAPDMPDGFFVVDGEGRAAWFVRPRPQIYMEARQSSPLTQLLVPVDPDDPCRQWQIMEDAAGMTDTPGDWQCDLVGREVVGGGETLKYLAISRQGQRSYRWIDPRRAFPVQVAAGNVTTVALKNIVDAPQSQSLCAIPANYRKFDPRQLIELIKQSDVWVESPR